MENEILLINRCDYMLKEFCEKYFSGSKLEDGCVLVYKNQKYDLIPCRPIGIILQRDIEMYRLSKCE